MLRPLTILLLILATAASAERLRFYGQGGAGPSPPVGCTPTGLDFTNQCNSVYIVAIGF